MGSTVMSEEYVTWSGDKKTEKFLKDHTSSSDNDDDDGGGSSSSSSSSSRTWYEALDSSQDVLVWSGKFIGGGNKGEQLHGAELPIIKTTSIIHKSPKYLAELLMDSTKVKAYNKMSLGRDDVNVFQTGVDTKVEEGKFGNVGESKIVRNLTRPPMVNSNLEFVSEYQFVLVCVVVRYALSSCVYMEDVEYTHTHFLILHSSTVSLYISSTPLLPSLHARTQTKSTRLTNTLLQQQRPHPTHRWVHRRKSCRHRRSMELFRFQQCTK